MPRNTVYILFGVLTLFTALVISGCQPSTGREGIHVMFDGVPKIYHNEVYFHGRIVGKIIDQQGINGPITNLTISIDPKMNRFAGEHWAFYVDSGRLTAGALNSSGQPLGPGDRVCGFHSKTDLTWFKIKTLLSHRISKANRRAEKLYLRFSQSG